MAHICCSSVSRAILDEDLKKLSELIREGKRIDIQDNLGNTPLHIAVKKQSRASINILVKHPDCEINAKNFEGYTSLHVACDTKKPSIKVIKILLNNGADVNIVNHELMVPLHLACKYGNLPLTHLLLSYGADINAKDVDEYTPLHFAVNSNHKIVVQYLLKNKADTSLCESNGLNPLMLAIIRKYEELFYILLPATENLNQLGKDSETAVGLSIVVSNFEILQKLVESGAEIYTLGPQSPLILSSLYQGSNIEVFQYIWSRVNHKLFFESAFFINLLSKLTLVDNFEYLYIIIQTLRLYPQCIENEVFINIFQCWRDSPDLEYFERYEKKLITIFQILFHKNVKIRTQELKKFMLFVKCCPYRIQLLTIALENLQLKYSENLIFYSFMSHPDVGLLFLQRAPFFYNFNEIFDIFIKTDRYEFVKYLLKFFSPSETTLRKMLKEVKNDFEKIMLRAFSGKVKSLREISRDAVRMYVGKNVNEHYINTHIEVVRKLNCPKIVEDILLLKKPVNEIVC